MDENNNNVMESARTLYAYLKEHCVGKEVSTWDLVRKVFPQLTNSDLWEIHEALGSVISEEGKYEMDLGSYANEYVGLPYCIPFVFRLKKTK